MSYGTRVNIAGKDLAAALGLLSRLPIPVDGAWATRRGAKSAWAWPIAGAVIGLICAVTATIAIWLNLAPVLVAAVVLIAQAFLTGAMHEDGLADCADGLWGGWTEKRRLEIMKDSAIGAYGVLALVLTLILRWQAIALVIESGLHWPVLITVAALSRAPMIAMMVALPPARSDGLSQSVGQPTRSTALTAGLLAILLALFLLGWSAILASLALIAAGIIWSAICHVKIGGQTGDTLGALQQISEVILLLSITALLGLG